MGDAAGEHAEALELLGLLRAALQFQPVLDRAATFRNVARDAQQTLRTLLLAENRRDHNIPETHLAARATAKGLELPGTATACRGDGLTHARLVRGIKEADERGVHQRLDVGDAQLAHAAAAHKQQVPVQIQNLDAILTMRDDAAVELLGLAQGRLRLAT